MLPGDASIAWRVPLSLSSPRLVQRVEADVTSVWTYDTAYGIGKLASSGITAGLGSGVVTMPYGALFFVKAVSK